MAHTDEPLTPDRPGADPATLITDSPAPEPAEKRITVTVVDGTQVNLEGTLYTGGQTLSAPRSVADAWIAWGWVAFLA